MGGEVVVGLVVVVVVVATKFLVVRVNVIVTGATMKKAVATESCNTSNDSKHLIRCIIMKLITIIDLLLIIGCVCVCVCVCVSTTSLDNQKEILEIRGIYLS